MNENNEKKREIAKKFKVDNTFCHITLKNRRFLNGFILSVNTNLILFNDRVFGRIITNINDIHKISKYIIRGK